MRRRSVIAGSVPAPLGSASIGRRRFVRALALIAASCCGSAWAEPMSDRLDTPAKPSARSQHGLLTALAVAGTRLVAAGQRGHILWSDDGGRQWTQAVVPVSSDLTALQFVDERNGWAVGHDGVVLHSQDGGASWSLQLDGRRIAGLLHELAAGLDPDTLADTLRELERSAEQGVDQSLLDLYFLDARTGFVVGANNLVLATRDGGATWRPWSDRVDNPRALHLYGVAEAFGRPFIVGEQGLILALADDGERFEALDSPYEGSWFGLLGQPDRLLVYGLRGNAWVSGDAGASWRRADLDSAVAITAADATPSGDLLLTGLGGEVFRSGDGGRHFRELPLAQGFPFAAIAALGDAEVAVAGVRGVRVVASPQEAGTP